MKKIGIFFILLAILLIASKIFFGISEYPEKVLDIVKHWALVWVKSGAIAAIVVTLIFIINKKCTEERTMSIIGMIIMPILIPILMYFCFGLIPWLTTLGILSGFIIGYFSYITDDHLLEAWKIRHIVLPLFFGLGFGTSCIIAALTENWQDEYVYVHDYATCHKIELQRYTRHVVRSKKSTSTYYSWDTYKSLFFFQRGEKYDDLYEGIDYTLSTGAFGKKDRVVNFFYKWIGGEKLTKSGKNLGFKWIYLDEINLKYPPKKVSEVEENFFGHAIYNGIKKDIPIPDITSPEQPLPKEDDVPGIFSMSIDFFKIMLTNPDFSLLRWIYVLIYLPFIIGAFFYEELRISLFIFFISSTVIILIIIGIIAARSGRALEDFIPRFGGFGGGRFGGAGAGSRW